MQVVEWTMDYGFTVLALTISPTMQVVEWTIDYGFIVLAIPISPTMQVVEWTKKITCNPNPN